MSPFDAAMMSPLEKVGESLHMERAAFGKIIERNPIDERDLRQIRKAEN